jgi:hypothetical protein
LSENGINIKRIKTGNESKITESEAENKNVLKSKKQPNLFETDKDYKKAFTNIKDMPIKNRPRKLNGFEAHLKNIFHKIVKEDKIKEIITEFKKLKYIEIENNEKIKYNL